MRFLADMSISQPVVTWLRTAGHDVVHLRDERLQVLPNVDVFRKGLLEDRIVLTFDVDPAIMRLELGFGEFISRDILAPSKERIVSTILLRLRNPRADFVIQRLDTVLTESRDALSGEIILVVEDERHFAPEVVRYGSVFVGTR